MLSKGYEEKMKSKNKTIQQVIAAMFVLLWMTTVFIFSSQDRTETLNTSGAFIYAIETTVKNDTQVESHKEEADEVKTQKYKYSEDVQKVVRKSAHYFLYMIGGVILSVFFYALLQDNKKYIFCSTIFGILYAFSDELHQMFVPGRTSSLKDVGIDSLGILTGVVLFMIFIKIVKLKKYKFKMGE